VANVVPRDQVVEVVATRRGSEEVVEVRKAKSAPDLVADTGKRRDDMTATVLGDFMSFQTAWYPFADGERRQSSFAMKEGRNI
jgi:hypothetical protein